ncbi:ornithine cyclodeaminase family protein [Culturomica massiliensis]|jgi:ornithine cyclodeaminase/alanine dehydrogenase-like protein (mu-crystallin family)|uniref:ornithine cyclodeaminase family protein n=1 Tax=Culturomica massiliensis TaxID=1841857 RepID=UPI002666E4D6|nr:hypothetical protein [Culturomica massiliensis]
MNTIKILSSEDIKNLVSMKEAINTIATAFCDLSAKNVNMPLRTITDFGENELTLFYKPSLMPSLHSVGIKLLSQYKTGGKNGHPTIQGIVVLIDPENNTTQAILDGTYLTALRTGAASGVATRALSREDSETFVLFGAGAQGYTQFEAVCCARNIKKAYIFDINKEAIDRFIRHYQNLGQVSLYPGEDLSVLPEADIISTVTNSKQPLFPLELLKKGAHINAIGSYNPSMHELPTNIFTSASLFVDHKDSCFSESGDIIIPLSEGLLPPEHYKGEIGEVLLSRIPGRTSPEEITVFKSVGIAIQDLAAANYAYRQACQQGRGTNIQL